MSLNTFTEIGMVDTRATPKTITMPLSTQIPSRVLTIKDIYGTAITSPITLQTQGADTFEDGTTSITLNNSYDSVTFYAGQPGRWYIISGTRVAAATINALSTSAINFSTLNGRTLDQLITIPLLSTVQGLGSFGYLSTQQLTASLTSTIQGLGSFGYVSTQSLLQTSNYFQNLFLYNVSSSASLNTSTLLVSSLTAIYANLQSAYVSTLIVNTLVTSPVMFGQIIVIGSLSAPTSLVLTTAGGTATLSWTSSSGATGYSWTLYQNATNTQIAGTVVTSGTTSSTSASITGLSLNIYYWFTVAATTSSTRSVNAISPIVKELIVDPSPLTLTVSGATLNLGCSLISGVINYTYTIYSNNVYSYTGTVVSTVSTASTSQSYSSTTQGTFYYFTVTVTTSEGTSALVFSPIVQIANTLSVSAPGTSLATISNYKVYTYTASGNANLTITYPSTFTVQTLLVGGGGGGGGQYDGGGGGAGGGVLSTVLVSTGTFAVTIGVGGVGGTGYTGTNAGPSNGSNTVFNGVTALGGGAGGWGGMAGNVASCAGSAGGCGGGAGWAYGTANGNTVNPIGGTGSQGFNGGTGGNLYVGNDVKGGGGGGGLGSAGGNGTTFYPYAGGVGGSGLIYTMLHGAVGPLGGGGGGGTDGTSSAPPGAGGGAGGSSTSQAGVSGSVNTGGGGGGAGGGGSGAANGGTGGSGVMVVVIPTIPSPVTNPSLTVISNWPSQPWTVSATLSWTGSTGSSDYNWTLYKSSTNSYSGVIVASGTTSSTNITVPSAPEGAYYYFTVVASLLGANSTSVASSIVLA